MSAGPARPGDEVGARQRRALAAVAARSRGGPLDPSARVTIHFHPDRDHLGVLTIDALARDGIYRSQFETGTSSGGLTAFVGGDRWRWESTLFEEAYDDAPAHERPKYGALDLVGASHGPAPRFGSCFLRLQPYCLRRATFCFPDSVFGPTWFATAESLSAVPDEALASDDPLDRYVEAHVHGPIELARDVEAVVLDPSFQDTDVEAHARRLGVPLEWHPGFALEVDALTALSDYRGPAAVELAKAIAEDGWLTPALIGAAARSGRGSAASLKHVWHLLAAFGRRSAARRIPPVSTSLRPRTS